MEKEKFDRATQIRRAIWRLSEDRSIVAGLGIEDDELEPIDVVITFKSGRRLVLPAEAFAVDAKEAVLGYIASFDKKIAELEKEFSEL